MMPFPWVTSVPGKRAEEGASTPTQLFREGKSRSFRIGQERGVDGKERDPRRDQCSAPRSSVV